MKKLSLLVVALFMAQFGIAQKGLEIGVNFMPANTWIINDEDFAEDQDLDFRGTFGFNAGLTLGYNFTNTVGITTGLFYSRQGQNYRTDYDNVAKADQDVFSRQLTYLRVPVLFRFGSQAEGASSGSFFRVGPYFDFMQSAKFTYDDKSVLNIDLDEDMRAQKIGTRDANIYQNMVIGGMLEMGTKIKINDNMGLLILFSLYGSITNTEGEDAGYFYPSSGFPNYNRSTSYNVGGGLNIGFNYVLPMGGE